jgi:glycosyltransferase involved in cell wall biosynthesis
MSIISKIKTAKMVLFKYGLKEFFGLFCDNIEEVYKRISGFLNSFFHRIIRRYIINKLQKNNNDKIKILYITNRQQSEKEHSIRYRIYNVIEALKGKAVISLEIIENGIYNDELSIIQADIIILMRVQWTEKLEKLIKIAKKHAIPLVYDIDDLIFLPEYAVHLCNAINEQQQLDDYTREFKRYQKAFKRCDFATTSTHFIAEQMRKANKTAFVINNGLNKKQLRIAGKTKKNQDDIRYICYLSGTKTHDIDFMQALPALLRIVKEYSNVRIRIVGYLDTANLPLEFLQKVEFMCFMSWKRLLKVSAKNYINIAPLDIQNPFCHAKSELKFYEAAIVGVPTVATATDTFERCITHNQNGMLASNDEEWYNAFKLLLDNKSVYDSVVQNGYEYVKQHYTPPVIADMALTAYKSITLQYKKVKG